MRVLASILIIAVVLQGTFAVTSKSSQSKLLLQKIGSNLEKSHLGRALKNMVQLANQLGYELDDLYAALDDLKNQLLQQQNDENSAYTDAEAQHVAQVAYFEGQIANYQDQLVQLGNDLAGYQQDLSDGESTLAQQQAALEASQQALETANNDLNRLDANFANLQAQYQDALNVLAEVIPQLQDASSHYNNAGLDQYSLVQMSNKFVSFAQKISAATSKLSKRHQLFIKPTVTFLSQLGQSGSSIDQAVALLQELAQWLQNDLQDLVNQHSVLSDHFNSVIAHETQVSDQLSNVDIPASLAAIDTAKQNISDTNDAIATVTEALNQAVDALNTENAQFDALTALHNAKVAQIQKEYGIVDQAEKIIQASDNDN